MQEQSIHDGQQKAQIRRKSIAAHGKAWRLSGDRRKGTEAQEGEETPSNEERWTKSRIQKERENTLRQEELRVRANA